MTTETVTNLWWDVLDFIYPQRCPVCQVTLSSGRELMCQNCMFRFREKKRLLEPYCPSCKRQSPSLSDGCGCEESDQALEAVFSLGVYDEEMKALIENFKYKRKRRLGSFLSEVLSERLLNSAEFPRADFIVTVPLHKRKLRERGFNQSEAVAGQLSEKLGIPVLSDSVIRKRNTRTQTGLSREERRKNVKGAFKLTGKVDLEGRRLLLVDDVLTTGATMSECARTLKSAGAERIWGATLAVAIGTELFKL
ncbi:MAG: ComF family protein [Candidatus Zixiibacteriota bacterium]